MACMYIVYACTMGRCRNHSSRISSLYIETNLTQLHRSIYYYNIQSKSTTECSKYVAKLPLFPVCQLGNLLIRNPSNRKPPMMQTFPTLSPIVTYMYLYTCMVLQSACVDKNCEHYIHACFDNVFYLVISSLSDIRVYYYCLYSS